MIKPYLHFKDDCEEAFLLYQRAFGGKIEGLTKYGELAPDPSMKDKVMHAEMMLTDVGGVAGADAGWPFEEGHSIHLMARQTEADARKAWAVLAEEAREKTDFSVQEGGLMAGLTDKYGFHWIFTVWPKDQA